MKVQSWQRQREKSWVLSVCVSSQGKLGRAWQRFSPTKQSSPKRCPPWLFSESGSWQELCNSSSRFWMTLTVQTCVISFWIISKNARSAPDVTMPGWTQHAWAGPELCKDSLAVTAVMGDSSWNWRMALVWCQFASSQSRHTAHFCFLFLFPGSCLAWAYKWHLWFNWAPSCSFRFKRNHGCGVLQLACLESPSISLRHPSPSQCRNWLHHILSIAFRHLSPNSARFG